MTSVYGTTRNEVESSHLISSQGALDTDSGYAMIDVKYSIWSASGIKVDTLLLVSMFQHGQSFSA